MDGYFNKCWICGGIAETGEHRFKKADIVRANGKGQYRRDDTLLHVSANSQTKVHGANSKSLKYPKSLCFDCNNNRSKQWDLTYDQLIDYVIENEEVILQNDTINLVDVFKDSCNEKVFLLQKYFAKSFGCKVYSANLKVPQEIIQCILSPFEVESNFKITFTINDDILLLNKVDRDGFIGKSDLFSDTRKF